RIPTPTFRTNANVRPSGEKVGWLSKTFFSGEVSLSFSLDSTESKNKPRGSWSEFLCMKTSELPSGGQASPLCEAPAFGSPVGLISATLRSGGPRGEVRNTEAFPDGSSRINAMEPPSGDQAGLESASGA